MRLLGGIAGWLGLARFAEIETETETLASVDEPSPESPNPNLRHELGLLKEMILDLDRPRPRPRRRAAPVIVQIREPKRPGLPRRPLWAATLHPNHARRDS